MRHSLPAEIRALADESFERLKQDTRHPSLHFKKIGIAWSARVGNRYRALAVEADDGLLWIWIGTHGDYDTLIGPRSGMIREPEAEYTVVPEDPIFGQT